MTIMPKVTSLVSSIALGTFIRCMIARRRENLQKMYHRLVFGMSIVDLIRSLSFLVGTWSVPPHAETYWEVGTKTTCTIQGFINQIGLAVPLYSAALCIYAYLIIRSNFQAESIAPVEIWLHGVSLSIAMVLSIALVVTDSATSMGSWCWLPTVSFKENAAASYVSIFSAGVVTISLLVGVTMIILILLAENKKRKERKEWRGKKKFMETHRARKAEHLTTQAMLHLAALIICNTFIIINPLIGTTQNFACVFIGNLLITLSGFLNVMVYTKLLNPSKPPPVSDISPSFSIRQVSANDIPIVTNGFNPCTKIPSTFGNMFVLNSDKYNADDFAVFTGDSDDEVDIYEKEQLRDQLSVTTADVESLGDVAVPPKNRSIATTFLGTLI